MTVAAKPVTLTKRCKIHGIDLPRDSALTSLFRETYPEASFDDGSNEWRIAWEKGHFAESNARLETFFAANGVSVSHVDKC